MERIILAIDPSIRHLGWAILSPHELIETGAIDQSSRNGDFVKRSDEAALKLSLLAPARGVTEAVIELPRHYSGGVRAEAARNSDDILKLMFQVATIRTRLSLPPSQIPVCLLKVETWKGNTDKSITARRVKRRWNFTHTNNNVIDAVGIGTYYLEHFPPPLSL